MYSISEIGFPSFLLTSKGVFLASEILSVTSLVPKVSRCEIGGEIEWARDAASRAQ
jgi:hypothetical protein